MCELYGFINSEIREIDIDKSDMDDLVKKLKEIQSNLNNISVQ